MSNPHTPPLHRQWSWSPLQLCLVIFLRNFLYAGPVVSFTEPQVTRCTRKNLTYKERMKKGHLFSNSNIELHWVNWPCVFYANSVIKENEKSDHFTKVYFSIYLSDLAIPTLGKSCQIRCTGPLRSVSLKWNDSLHLKRYVISVLQILVRIIISPLCYFNTIRHLAHLEFS